MEHNLYWPVYLNIEKEFLHLAESIHIDDSQVEVYSMKIAELLIRTAVEFEALAKNLYFVNGGTKADSKELYFDTDCMEHLVNIWNIDKRVVMVSFPILFLEKEENVLLTPLHKTNKRGTSSADWCKAYQAVKHNRVKDLRKGNIKNFMRALAALYILNLYYRDEKVSFIIPGKEPLQDFSFGSQIFSVMRPNNISQVYTDGRYPKGADFEKHVYVAVPNDFKYKELVTLMNKENDETQFNLIQKLESQIKAGEVLPTQEDISTFLSKERSKVANDVAQKYAYEVGRKFMEMSYTAELNKNQPCFNNTSPAK